MLDGVRPPPLCWIAAALAASATGAVAAPRPPCAGCTLDVPADRDGALPLLVVLHGDRERAAPAADRWRAAAKDRGWAVLSLACPVDRGCKASWWQWNGEPSWVTDQVDAVARAVAIDPARIYLAGWSGGATYLGMHAPAWTTTFAAVVVHGGGHEPRAACPEAPLPAYFLFGDRNPLHALVVDLRAWFDGCKQDVVWDLVRGADHDHEDRALDRKKARAILDWLDAHRRG
jgi:poly(3-hydroxybutyrate) depolymerase